MHSKGAINGKYKANIGGCPDTVKFCGTGRPFVVSVCTDIGGAYSKARETGIMISLLKTIK